MPDWKSRTAGIIDGHVHMGGLEEEDGMLSVLDAAGIEKAALVSIQSPETGTGLPQSLYMKARHPDRFFVFAGLNHVEKFSGGRVSYAGLAEQVERFAAVGCDGIKMIEGKPTFRRHLNLPLTHDYYAGYWERVEALGLPVVWHVADPEEFWEADKLPAWAKERQWGYGPDDVAKERLHSETLEILARHPRLKVILAHFHFLSADLPRAARLLDEHPGLCFDLAPGIEMLYNISRDPDAGRDFFMRHSDRIVFGTDMASELTRNEARVRAGIVYRWLEGPGAFRLPAHADGLLGNPDDRVIRGMNLPDEVLHRIYRANFAAKASSEPLPLKVSEAIEECRRIAAAAEAMSGRPASGMEAARVARFLESRV